jgi:hypothetical protein
MLTCLPADILRKIVVQSECLGLSCACRVLKNICNPRVCSDMIVYHTQNASLNDALNIIARLCKHVPWNDQHQPHPAWLMSAIQECVHALWVSRSATNDPDNEVHLQHQTSAVYDAIVYFMNTSDYKFVRYMVSFYGWHAEAFALRFADLANPASMACLCLYMVDYGVIDLTRTDFSKVDKHLIDVYASLRSVRLPLMQLVVLFGLSDNASLCDCVCRTIANTSHMSEYIMEFYENHNRDILLLERIVDEISRSIPALLPDRALLAAHPGADANIVDWCRRS